MMMRNKIWLDRHFGLALAQLLVFAALILQGSSRNSYINDEAARLGAGFSYLTEWNMRLNPEDPPLGKDLSALPLVLLFDLTAPRAIDSLTPGNIGYGDSFTYGTELLTKQDLPMQKLLFWGRMPTLVFSLLLGLLIFWCGRRQFGGWCGNLALVFYTFSPTMISHSGFVTLDVPAGFATMATIWAYILLLERPTTLRLMAATVAFTLAISLKFILWVLFPFLVLTTILWTYAERQLTHFRPWRNLGIIFLTALMALFMLYKAHFLRYPQAQFHAEIQALVTETQYAAWAPQVIAIASYPVLDVLVQIILGIGYRLTHAVSFSYFDGQGFFGGDWRFYPAALLLKEPLALTILLVVALTGAGFALTQRVKKQRSNGAMHFRERLNRRLPLVIMTLWCSIYGVIAIFLFQIVDGLRHLTPITPFLFIFIAAGTLRFIEQQGRFRRAAAAACALLVLWEVVSVLQNHPSHLAYVNELGGGSDQGVRRFALSSYELGSEAKRLADWTAARGIEKMKVASSAEFFTAEHPGTTLKMGWYYPSYEYYLGPRYVAWDGKQPTTGWLAIPGSLFNWGLARPRESAGWGSDTFRWLEDIEPVARIGHAVYIFYIDQLPTSSANRHPARILAYEQALKRTPSAELHFGLGFFQRESLDVDGAIRSYKAALTFDAKLTNAYNNLGVLYTDLHRYPEAIEVLKQGVAIDAHSDLLRNNLAAAERLLGILPQH